MKTYKAIALIFIIFLSSFNLYSQETRKSLVDKTVAIVGDEMITLSSLEQELQYMKANGMDNMDLCGILEKTLEQKLFLSQARIDSLKINHEYVNNMLKARINELRTALGGDDKVEAYFSKPMYQLRREWKKNLEDQSLTQQMQQTIASKIGDIGPYDVKKYLASVDTLDLPMVPKQYELSQICIYPDKEKANSAVKEKLLALRERILHGASFATMARIYSQDPGSAMKGGELGLTPKSNFWPAFSDAAMALKPGIISQIVETPDGFHLIEVIEKKGDMFNARHILMRPQYTEEDREKAFKRLDSLRSAIQKGDLKFDLAAKFYSQDPNSRINGGRISDAQSGSILIDIDKIYPPSDYDAIKNLKVGEISKPVESLDREGRRGNTVYKILKVDKIVPAHRANFNQDYALLLQICKEKAAKEAINKFLNDKIKKTNIYIDPMFATCKFERKEWASKLKKK